MKLALRLCLAAALLAPAAARAADDTARFYGQWKTTVVVNGQKVTIISLHDSNGFRNYLVTPTGLTFVGSGAFSAANGIWMAAAPAPDNGGAYHFTDSNTAVCSNAIGQTVTWRRDRTPLPQEIAPPAQPETAAAPAPEPPAPASAPPPAAPSKRGFEAQPPADNGPYTPGKNYALVIGIDDYAAPLPKLQTAVNDARSIATLLSTRYGFQVTTLLNHDATRDKIFEALTHFRKALAENDSFLIYYAGHGSYDRTTDKGYWLPIDADPDPLITSHDISADDLVTEVRGLAARHVLIISDSCFSGDLSRAPSRTLMASGSDEPVSDSGSQGHSVFAALLLQAMQSQTAQPLTADDVFVSIRKGVLARSGQSPQYSSLRNSIQPNATLDTGDFVFNPTTKPK